MASEQPGEAPGPSSEPPEHDYAHSAGQGLTCVEETCSSSALASAATPMLPPEPPVGAEVDCPVGNEAVEVQFGTEAPVSGRSRRGAPKAESGRCACCHSEFLRQGRGFTRRAVFTFTSTETVLWVFPGCSVNEKSYLCESCAKVIRSKCKRKQRGKRPLWLRPPETKQVRDKNMPLRRMGKKSQAAQLVSKSRYKAAFQTLWSAKGARKPMLDFWSKQLKKEMKALSRHPSSPFHLKVSGRKPLSSFPWRRCLNWAQDNAPLVVTCLRSLFPDVKALFKSRHQLTEEQAFTMLERRTVVALSIPLFTRNTWRNNFLQAALGAELRLQGCSSSALDILNPMGLCQNKDTVRLLLHRLQDNKGVPMQDGLGPDNMRELMGNMEGVNMEEEVADDDEEEEEEDEDEEEEEEEEEEEMAEEMALSGEEEEVREVEIQAAATEEVEAVPKGEKRWKKAKKKRKTLGKRKMKEEEGGEVEVELEGDDEELEVKKRRVVVVRLGLLGHSEVGRSDLSAP